MSSTKWTTANISPTTAAKNRDVLSRKLVIVGDGTCGKTSLLSVFALGHFPEQYNPTVFETHVMEVKIDEISVNLSLWDTAGQEEFERLRPLSYSRANVILIAFAVDVPDSLDNVTAKWIEEVNRDCPDTPIILVGLKKDLRQQKQTTTAPMLGVANPAAGASDTSLDLPKIQKPASMFEDEDNLDGFVRPEQAEKVAKEIGARRYLECSALTGEGVDDVFENATRAALLKSNGEGPFGCGCDCGCCIIL